jgi:hypothetical protein
MWAAIKCSWVAVVVVVFFTGCHGACVAQQETVSGTVHEPSYKYDTPGIRLEGTLIERKVYGPPGYGETPAKDERSTILILKLSHAINVEPTANAEASGSASLDPEKNVREVQLFVDRSQTVAARKLLGKVVVAVGTLNEAAAPSQYTKVWLDSKTLNPK